MMKKSRKHVLLLSFLLLCFVTISFIGHSNFRFQASFIMPKDETTSNTLTIHFFNVGQGESILIQSEDEAMLVDAGSEENAPFLIQSLKLAGVQKLKYVIATHPHDDHVGAMAAILDAYDIQTVILSKRYLPNLEYQRVLDVIQKQQITVLYPQVNEIYTLNNDSFQFLGPLDNDRPEVNNSSLVFRYVHQNVSILFTGDMEKEAEQDLLNKGNFLQSTLLKVGHHGSETSSTEDFIKAVDPEGAIISVGPQNIYDLPDTLVLNQFKRHQIPVYRTDQMGTLILESDGTSYSIHP